MAFGVLARAKNAVRERRYRRLLAAGEPAGELTWVFDPEPPPPPLVEVRLPASVDRDQAAAWCERQTLAELRAVGLEADGSEAWRVEAATGGGPERAAWFAAPGGLPDLLPVHLESSLLVAAAERVDAVVLSERVPSSNAPRLKAATDAASADARPFALYAAESWRHDPADDAVSAAAETLLVKVIGPDGVGNLPHDSEHANSHRRGPYLASPPLGTTLAVPVRDAARLDRTPQPDDRPTVLVTVPFLARGGAEHTLFETMRELGGSARFAVATLAPHRPELGDRREDFRGLTERLYCLGDLVHPAAMYGMLVALVDSLAADVLYNANSTTLFYDFAPRLRADRPELRIVDHLYDHRVGYIERFGPDLLDHVDSCVAENHRIAEVLTGERGWPADRVPVIWPCGRPPSAFPPVADRAQVRREIRRQIGIGADDVVFITAARMHPQKRPLDLVQLARRVRDLEQVQFLLVGGGELEEEVDRAIATAGARIRRLPFRTDIPDLIVASDVGCLVSDFEGLPVFMLECLQAGKPFLGTDVGDLGEVLRRTGAGVVVDRPGDLAALEAGVRQLADADEWSAMARCAVDSAALFDPSACAEAYRAALFGTAP
jgi:glycosyltransferase involved in cell wall biosynthesis